MRRMAFAAGMAMMAAACAAGTICVGGQGSVKVEPDMMRLRFSVEAIDKDMAKSAALFAATNAAVLKALAAAGATTNEVATSRIDMEPRYHREERKGKVAGQAGKRVFDGYCHSTTFTFAAPLDRVRLEKVYKAVVGCKTGTEIRLDFFVNDRKAEQAQSHARRMAVANAQACARELCEAAGTALGEVETINYMGGRNGPYMDICAMDVCCAAEEKCAAPVLPATKVEDVEVSDRVTITWKLK